MIYHIGLQLFCGCSLWMRERAHDQKIFIFLYKNPLYFRLYLAIINSGDEKLDTTVSGVVGFKVVADQKRKAAVQAVFLFL